MAKQIMVSVSTDPAKNVSDLYLLSKSVAKVASFIHCDIMDGIFVKKNKGSCATIKMLKSNLSNMLDVHLMVKSPKVEKYITAGANLVSIHKSAFLTDKQFETSLKKIKKLGALCGIAISPKTRITDVRKFLEIANVILIMSVEPGESGQTFNEEVIEKIKTLSALKVTHKYGYLIEVDGGVIPEIATKLSQIGVDIVVSGSYVYNSKNRASAVRELSQINKKADIISNQEEIDVKEETFIENKDTQISMDKPVLNEKIKMLYQKNILENSQHKDNQEVKVKIKPVLNDKIKELFGKVEQNNADTETQNKNIENMEKRKRWILGEED
ncbi:MAG: ribulose-phosphate 3-epimerase [Clostridia bacterium]